MRHDERKNNELRTITIDRDILMHPEGSVLVSFGNTKVICTATFEDRVPPFLRGKGTGWVNAEYSMLPRATATRNIRESAKGKLKGRTMEIQRLIARSLRAVVDLEKLGERSLTVDCDVIQADGGTRTASITGAYVALELAIQKLLSEGILEENPLKEFVAAVSVGVLPNKEVVLDLDYVEDSSAAVDMNLVMTESGEFVEIQGTGEEATFTHRELQEMLSIGEKGLQEIIAIQKEVCQTTSEVVEIITATDTMVIATRNPGKAAEFKDMFGGRGYIVKTLLDYPELADVEETGTTFAENAALKAETISKELNCIVIADDSGLMVDALQGQPGVYSARYAGEMKSDAANNAKLMHELTGMPPEKRGAKFHCTLAVAAPGKETLFVSGEVSGEILTIPRGENGFGYDPLFYVPEFGKSMAELTRDEKNQVSHRAIASAALENELDQWMEG